jgi:hypothetical protein
MVVLLHRFLNVGKARHCNTFEHLIGLPWKSRCRYVLDEAQEKKMFEALAP